jgi:uncharacterized membrane protein
MLDKLFEKSMWGQGIFFSIFIVGQLATVSNMTFALIMFWIGFLGMLISMILMVLSFCIDPK